MTKVNPKKSPETDELGDVLNQINTERTNLQIVENECFDKKRELAKLEKEADDWKKQIDIMQGELKKIKAEFADAVKELKPSKSNLDELEEKKRKIKGEMDNMVDKKTQTIADLEIAIKAKSDNITALQNEYDNKASILSAELVSIQDKISDYNTVLGNITVQEAKLTKNVQSKSEELDSLMDVIHAKQKNIEEIEKLTKAAGDMFKENLKKNEDLVKEKAKIDNDIGLATKELEGVTKQVEEQQHKFLTSVARERKVNELAEKVTNLYREAGINIII